MASHPTFCRKHTSAEAILVKIGTIVHFGVKKSQKIILTDSDIFDGVITSSVLNAASHPTFCRKHTSAEPILVTIGTIVHFDV